MGRLFRTTAFRLSLLYAGVFSVLAAAALGFIYWSTASYVEQETDARLRLETQVLLNKYRDQALPALVESVQQRSRDDGGTSVFFYLLQGPDRSRLAGRLSGWPSRLEGTMSYATLRLSEVVRLREGDDSDHRVRVLVTGLAGGYRLLVGRDLNDERRLLDHMFNVVLGAIVITFVLALLGGALIGHWGRRRIDAVSRAAGEIMRGDLSQRIPLGPYGNEFDELARKLNAMLERIEQLMVSMREVTDNVAHDLRSPLNRLRSRLDVSLLGKRSEDEYRTVIEQSIADADGLLKTFNSLLSIAQAEAGVRRSDWEDVDLADLINDLTELYEPIAEERGLSVHHRSSARVTVHGHRELLAQALGNIIDNAVKYTPKGGRVELRVGRHDEVPEVVVADTGPGIPAAERAHVLERFVRLETHRATPGNGLGLSLTAAVIGLHGATLTLDDNHPGLRVTLRFPASEEATTPAPAGNRATPLN